MGRFYIAAALSVAVFAAGNAQAAGSKTVKVAPPSICPAASATNRLSAACRNDRLQKARVILIAALALSSSAPFSVR